MEKLVISIIYLVFNLTWLAIYDPIIPYLLSKSINKAGTLGTLYIKEPSKYISTYIKEPSKYVSI